MTLSCLVLALLSIWDYSDRYFAHERYRHQFIAASEARDYVMAVKVCREGVKLLPDDPTWHYNLACSLAQVKNGEKEALDELERAIDLGFRNRKVMEKDQDLKSLSSNRRYEELMEYADMMKDRPVLMCPTYNAVEATGSFGGSLALGEQNLGWDFSQGYFVAKLKLEGGTSGGNTGDLYMNRDKMHSAINPMDFPGLTVIKYDEEGRKRKQDICSPNLSVPYPLFGNCSMALVGSDSWRSIPRAIMTSESWQIGKMAKFYVSNQVWVFPSNADTAPVGTNGDVFASITPYWIVTAGRSFSDLPYLRAALEASRSLDPVVKAEIVKRGMLAPMMQVLIRKSLKGVESEDDYLTSRAHPTAMPSEGIDLARLKKSAAELKIADIPPLAGVSVRSVAPSDTPKHTELTYATPFAWAIVLRAEQAKREFIISATGANEFAFVQTHGSGTKAMIEPLSKNQVKVTIDKNALSPTNRIDIAVMGRNANTGWGAPSYVSFARMDENAPYSDPVLTFRAHPTAK